jgi:hypothetical protein
VLSLGSRYRRDDDSAFLPRVREFCPSNIARFLLGVVIIVALLPAIGFWLYQEPGHGTSIEQPTHVPDPVK